MIALFTRLLRAISRRIDRWQAALLLSQMHNPLRVGNVVISDATDGIVLDDGRVQLDDGQVIPSDQIIATGAEPRPGDRVRMIKRS